MGTGDCQDATIQNNMARVMHAYVITPEACAEAPERIAESAADRRHLYKAENDGSRGGGNMQSAPLLENG